MPVLCKLNIKRKLVRTLFKLQKVLTIKTGDISTALSGPNLNFIHLVTPRESIFNPVGKTTFIMFYTYVEVITRQ